MLIRGLIIAILLFVSNLLNGQVVGAQDFDFNVAYQDYVFAVDNYRSKDNVYQLKKSEYLRFGTLTAKTEAEIATREFLHARDEVLKTYLTALRMKLVEQPGVSDVDKDSVFSQIDSEVGWYVDHQNRINAAGTLEDLVEDSLEAKERYDEITSVVAFRTLHMISRAKVLHLTGPQEDLINRTDSLISRVRSEGKKSTVIIERWLLDAKNEIQRAKEKTNNANESMMTISKARNLSSKRSTYNTSISQLVQAHQHLKDANKFLGEIITEVKTSD